MLTASTCTKIMFCGNVTYLAFAFSASIVNADSMPFALCSGVKLLWHPPDTQFSKRQVLRDSIVQQGVGYLRKITAGTAALCSMYFTVGGAGIRASIINRCNDATVRTREIPLVHVMSLLYHVHAVASCNK